MADVNANIGVNIDASDALVQLKNLQRQIAQFHSAVAKSSDAAALAQSNLQKNFINGVNSIGAFSAELRTVKTTAESFTDSLEKNKFSMREYFRYSAGATKTFGRLFRSEFDTVNKVAVENVKRLQTQYIKMGRDANGAMKAIAIMPTELDMTNLSTKTQIAAQRQAIFNQLVKQGSTNLLNFGKNTQWAGRQLMVGFTLPLMTLGSVATRTFMEMETAAIKFKKVYGDMFTAPEETKFALESIQMLGQEFTKYGIAVASTVSLAAEAAAAGFQGQALQTQVTQATRLQVLGQVEQQKALETTISLQNAFQMQSEELADAINFLNAVENQTVVSLDDITTAIPKAAPVVKQLGGDVRDLAFFMAAMKEGGINASEGANALKSGLASLINPTNKAKEMMKGFGIDIDSIVNKNAGNVKQTVVEFAEALDGLSNLNRQRAIEQLFGKFQLARLSTLFENVTKNGNQASRVLDLAALSMEDLASMAEKELGITADSTMNKFRASVENLKLALVPVGESFLQIITPILEKLNSLLNWFNGLSDTSKKVITKVLLYLGGIAPVLLMTIGLMANFVANGIKGLNLLRNGFLRLTGQSKVLGEQTNYLTIEQQNAYAAAHSLEQSHARLAQTFTVEAGALAALRREYGLALTAANNFALANPRMMMPRPGKKYAKGIVSVPGPKGAGDIIPAMLSPGEAIIPSKMAKKYAPLINGMIAGNIPGFSEGLSADQRSFIAQVAPRITGKSKGKTSIEFLESELLAIPQELSSQFEEMIRSLTQETTTSLNNLKENLREIRSQYRGNIGQGNRAEFGHVDQGQKISARALKASGALTDPESITNLNVLESILPNKEIQLKSGYGFDLKGKLNNSMSKAGASLQEVVDDFTTRGPEKWQKMIEIGGGNFDELTGEINQYNDAMLNGLQQKLNSGAKVIFDSDAQIESARQKAIAAGKSFDANVHTSLETIDREVRSNLRNLGTRLNAVIQRATNTITEERVNFSDAEIARLGQTAEGREFLRSAGVTGGRKSGRLRTGGSNIGRKFGGHGDMPRQVVDELITETATAAGTQSPSTRTIPIGEDIARGLQVGMKNQIPQTKAVAQQLSNSATGLINPKTNKPFTDAEMNAINPQRSRAGAVFLGMPDMPDPRGPVTPDLIDEAYKEKQQREKGSKRGRIRGMVGRGAQRVARGGGGFGLSGLLFGLSMLPGKFGQLAQSIMPVVFGLQGLSMMLRIIGPLPTLLIAMSAGIFMFNKSVKNATEEIAKSAKAEAEARLGSAKAIQEYAEFTGKALPSAREFSRNNRRLISASGEAVKRFAEFYAKPGSAATRAINAGAEGGRKAGINAAAIDVAQRAAIFGLSPEDIAANIKAASDLIGADQVELKAKIQELLAPNGKDITKEPLTIQTKLEFLKENAETNIKSIGETINNISKITIPKFTQFAPAPNFKELERVAGYQAEKNRLSEKGGVVGSIQSGFSSIFSGAFGDRFAPQLKEYEKIQGQVQGATTQLSLGFMQQTESLALLNGQYSDGLITKEEYDAQMIISSENFAKLGESGKDLITQLDKIDASGGLSAAALKDLGNEAFAALKKSNPQLFKKITKSLEGLDKAAQIDIMMGYAQGSLTILDVAKLPELLESIDGKTVQAAIKILADAGIGAGLLEGDIRKRLTEIDKEIGAYAGRKIGPDQARAIQRLRDEKRALSADLKAIEEEKKVNKTGNLDTDDGDGTTKGTGDEKLSFFEKELKMLNKKRDALKEINDEMKRQNDYQQKQMNLISQAAQAKISGNYLQAAMLGQQSVGLASEYARESQELQMGKVIDITEAAKSAAEKRKKYSAADYKLKGNIKSGNYGAISPLAKTPDTGLNYPTGGMVYNITQNISGPGMEEVVAAVGKETERVIRKNNKSNKVIS